ncbi:MAG: hypothetical protein BM555_04565 [Crocinitomix sp. MedPE-SWsnd]|jgi:hypothetical protein|nr:MAG: hypothetical protein BM555_04565 [Crocinitomix sp. MedPE-SWsnd]
MKNWILLSSALIAIVVFSCAGGSNEDAEDLQNLVDGINQITDDGPASTCEKTTVDQWDNFLGVPYGTNETDLDRRLGKFTGGEWIADSSAFVYEFKRVKRAPVSVWVNGKTGKVETIFIEILGLNEFFEQDLKDVEEEFDIQECDMRFLGIQAEELIKIMGKPSKDVTSEEGYRSIFYDSTGLKISVNFKFYDSQGGRCSSISLNWFY